MGSLARNLNSYSLVDTRGAWEMQRASAPERRVFLLTRSTFAGQQRHAAVLWSGDVHASWKVFRNQIAAGLHYALGGMPYWTTDIGGFLGGDPAAPGYRELFIRWFQFGAFCPIFRVHGSRANDQNELWSYGPEAQKIHDPWPSGPRCPTSSAARSSDRFCATPGPAGWT